MSTSNSEKCSNSLEQWFWPNNSSGLIPIVGMQTKSNSSSGLTSANSTFGRRHRHHWWKVCWVYNNGNLIYQGLKSRQQNVNDGTNGHQMNGHEMNQHALNEKIAHDRCANEDDFFAASSKINKSFNEEKHSFETIMQQHHSSNHFHQQSSSLSSNFLPQKLAQPFNLLLRQKSEQNNISQFFVQYKGVNWRAEHLQYQIPSQDTQLLKQSSNEAKFVKSQQRKSQVKPQLIYNKLNNFCNKCTKAIDLGVFCVKISLPNFGNSNGGYTGNIDDEDSLVLQSDSLDIIKAQNNGTTLMTHIECFTCAICDEMIADFKGFLNLNPKNTNRANYFYCFRHFLELFKPRCQYCDILIFEEECTEAEGKIWHIGHFCCTECKRSLGGQQYIMTEPKLKNGEKSNQENSTIIIKKLNNQLPYCLTCFDILYGELCEECGELISCDTGSIAHEGRSWHAKSDCFKCNFCFNSLLGKPFLPASNGKIYCSYTCSQTALQRSHLVNKKLKERHNFDLIKNQSDINDQRNINNGLNSKVTWAPEEQREETYTCKEFNHKDLRTNNMQNQTNHHEHSSNSIDQSKELTKVQSNEDHNDKELKSFKEFMENKFINEFQPSSPSTNELPKQESVQKSKNPFHFENMSQFLIEYMNSQIQTQQFQNNLIGATLEYESCLSEEEFSNTISQDRKEQFDEKNDIVNGNQYEMSTSFLSSQNFSKSNQIDGNSNKIDSNSNKITQQNPTSSCENTTLLPIDQIKLGNKSENKFENHDFESLDSNKKDYEMDLLQESICISSNLQNLQKEQLNEDSIAEPSTESTAINSTSSQTTPETQQKSTTKSVSFDPSVKEPVAKTPTRRNKKTISRKNWSDDSLSSSSCSTCSSSSDDDYDYDLNKQRNQWYGGTRIQYVSSSDKKKQRQSLDQNNESFNKSNNESCTIS